MGRGLKIGLGVLAVVVVVFVGAIILVYSNLDGIVKEAVEEFGPQFAGVPVTLQKVELSPENGRGKLTGLFVGNPPGYKTDGAFKLGSVSVDIDLSSLTSDTIVIRKVEIDGPDVTYEFGDGGSNVDVIASNVEKAAGGPPGGSGSSGKASSGGASGGSEGKDSGGPEKKMIIESLVITNGRVSISHPLLEGEKIGSALPTIRLKDIGKNKNGGATPAQAVDAVMDAMEKNIATAVSTSGVNDLLKGVAKGVEGVAKEAEGVLKNLFGK